MRNNETEAALKSFQKILELDPKHEYALRQLSEFYVRRFEYDQAKSCLLKAIKFYPEEARLYTELGITHL